MAAKRKSRNKRYNPHKTAVSGGTGLELMNYFQLKNSDEPVPPGIISDFRERLDDFGAKLRSGTLSPAEFIGLCEVSCLSGHLLLHLRPMQLSADETQNMIIKTALSIRLDFVKDTFSGSLDRLSARYTATSRMVADGMLLRHYEQFCREFLETLSFVRTRDLIAAFSTCERDLRTLPHRPRKLQKKGNRHAGTA